MIIDPLFIQQVKEGEADRNKVDEFNEKFIDLYRKQIVHIFHYLEEKYGDSLSFSDSAITVVERYLDAEQGIFENAETNGDLDATVRNYRSGVINYPFRFQHGTEYAFVLDDHIFNKILGLKIKSHSTNPTPDPQTEPKTKVVKPKINGRVVNKKNMKLIFGG